MMKKMMIIIIAARATILKAMQASYKPGGLSAKATILL
jgi:hypothetical protein